MTNGDKKEQHDYNLELISVYVALLENISETGLTASEMLGRESFAEKSLGELKRG